MTTTQKIIKYCAIAFAVFLIAGIIGGIASAIDGTAHIFGKKPSGEMKTLDISGEISSLDFDIGASSLEIKSGSAFALESDGDITYSVKDGVLKVKENRHIFSGSTAGTVVLTVPEKFVFNKVKIENGAGRFTADYMSADYLNLDFGAGKTDIGFLSAIRSADINCGAGKFTVSDGVMANLKFDMGAGEGNIKSRLLGNSSIDCGVGAMNFALIGTDHDYTIDIDKGIGEVIIDGEKAGGGIYGKGADKVEIDGGVGAINITFTNYK